MSQQSLCMTETGAQLIRYRPPVNPDGRIDLNIQISFPYHRSGWAYALSSLCPLHNPRGVLFDGFLDTTFNSIGRHSGLESLPYRRPWVGFFHNPPHIPQWFPRQPTIQELLKSELFQASLPACRGFFTLSEHLARFVQQSIPGKPVSVFISPTEPDVALFDFAAFLRNQHKIVVQIGWWLRKLNSIYRLPLDRNSPYRKWQLTTGVAAINQTMRGLSRLEFVHDLNARKPLAACYRENTEIKDYISNEEYDGLLTQNIGFLDLYDAGANNAVVECLARATPLLVNPIPPVVEYLGEDYPFYFETLEQAAEKALDFDLVRQAHEYLLDCPTRSRLSGGCFLESVVNSEVYQQLPQPQPQNMAG